MKPVKSTQTDIAERAARAREWFLHTGTAVAVWSRERGYKPTLVHEVLTGRRACRRGMSHNIAVELQIKDGAINEESKP